MERNGHRPREVIAQGMEHNVLRPASGRPDIVVKTPRPFNTLSMVGRDPAQVLRQELREARESVHGTEVQVPRTMILGINKSVLGVIPVRRYVIGQRYIQEDESVPDVQGKLTNNGLNSLVDEHKHEPRNFITQNGIIYWVDPTRGTVGRILERTRVMKLDTYRRIRRRFSKVIRFFGL
jgi:hypothetical protein